MFICIKVTFSLHMLHWIKEELKTSFTLPIWKFWHFCKNTSLLVHKKLEKLFKIHIFIKSGKSGRTKMYHTWWLVPKARGRGFSHIKAKRGGATLMGHFFTRNPKTWAPIFTKKKKKSLHMGPVFRLCPNFAFLHGEHPKLKNLWKIGLFFKKNH